MKDTVFDAVAFKRLCAYKGFTQKQIAVLLGIGRSTLSKKVSGKTDFTRSELIRLCEILGESLETMLPIIFAQKVS
jgi:transcriptional regulator with XRE-family HTH domain